MAQRVLILAFTAIAAAQNSQLPGAWPKMDKIPATRPEWSQHYSPSTSWVSPAHIKCYNPSHWGLTFDDGPTEHTNVVLDILKRRNLKATFFVVGSRVKQYPQIVDRIHKEGHQIALHTWSHTPLVNLTNDQLISEMLWNIHAVKEAAGVSPRFMRPPTGRLNVRTSRVLNSMGLVAVNWTRDTEDWQFSKDPTMGLKMLEEARNWVTTEFPAIGDISLQHDIEKTAVDNAERFIDIIQSFEVQIIPVGDCLNEPWYFGAETMIPPKPANLPADQMDTTPAQGTHKDRPTDLFGLSNSAPALVSFPLAIIVTLAFLAH